MAGVSTAAVDSCATPLARGAAVSDVEMVASLYEPLSTTGMAIPSCGAMLRANTNG